MKKQIELLKKYEVKNYTIENNKITINGSLYLRSLTTADKDFLKGTTINGSLYFSSLTTADKDFLKGTAINGYLDLRSLTTADKDFLKGATINGSLDLRSLTTADKDFLKGATINGSLDLRSLTTADKDFLKGTTINGYLYFSSLTTADKDFLKVNVKQLKRGYNKKDNYCFFDNILSKILSVTTKKGYTIYTTPFEFVAQKGKYTSHGKTVKRAIQDLEFKVISENLKKEPILKDTIIDINYYHTVTGSCILGIESFKKQHNLKDSYKAQDLFNVLKDKNAYGFEKFKSLITF